MSNGLDEPLDPPAARALIRAILADGSVRFSRHGLEEMAKDGLSELDVTNVLRGGTVDPAEFEHGSWRYRVRTQRIAVVIARHRLSLGDLPRRRDRLEDHAMKCMQCGSTMKTKRESYLYDQGGIKATLLGVPVHRCPDCGDFEVEIPRIEELNRTLAGAIIRKPTRLSAAEIRFLRKSLGWSGADFARHIGVDPATVSRWETGAQDMGQVADRFLRLLVSVGTPVENYSLDDLADLRDAPPPRDTPPLKLKQSPTGWHPVAA